VNLTPQRRVLKVIKNSMKTFIWKELPVVSSRYHSGGGAVVIAENKERAEELLRETVKKYREEVEMDMTDFKIDSEPYIIEGGLEEKVFIFPDAGCC